MWNHYSSYLSFSLSQNTYFQNPISQQISTRKSKQKKSHKAAALAYLHLPRHFSSSLRSIATNLSTRKPSSFSRNPAGTWPHPRPSNNLLPLHHLRNQIRGQSKPSTPSSTIAGQNLPRLHLTVIAPRQFTKTHLWILLPCTCVLAAKLSACDLF